MASQPAPSILVVDDERQLLALMQTFLERNGYAVRSCGDAKTALEKFRANPGQYQMVIADLSLPDIQGDQMALEMVKEESDLRVLLCSGLPYDIDSLPAAVRARFGMLQKPFKPNELISAVEELLQRSR